MQHVKSHVGIAGVVLALVCGAGYRPQPACGMDATQAYRLRQAFQRQERNMQAVEKTLGQLAAYVEKTKYIPKWDDRGIPTKVKAIEDNLKKNGVPKDDARYVKLKERMDRALKQLADLSAKAQPAVRAYDKYTNIKNYPDYDKDLRRTEAIGKMYKVGGTAFQVPARAKPLVTDFDRVVDYVNGNAKKYAPLINFKTSHGERFGAKQKWAVRNLLGFKKARDAYTTSAPAKIRALLNRAGQLAERAKATKNPRLLSRGARQALDEATENVGLFVAIKGTDDPEAVKLAKSLAAKQKNISAAADALKDEIIASTQTPPDEYAGPDKADLVAKARGAWSKKHPDDKILAIRCHQKQWRRTAGLEWNTARKRWELFDRQVLAKSVIVKTSDRIATIYPAFLNRDNVSNTENVGVATKSGRYVVREMLLANLEQ